MGHVAKGSVKQTPARHEHLTKLKLYSPSKLILLDYACMVNPVNFEAGTKPRAPDAASAAGGVC
jgi:hypothetical protein